MGRWPCQSCPEGSSCPAGLLSAQQVTRGLPPSSFPIFPAPGTTLRPWPDARLDTATPPVPPSRPRSADQMLRGHPGLPRPPTSVQPASPQCPGEKGPVAPAEAPVILSSPRTSKTDSYELVWRPRHEGGSRAPILYYEVKHRKVWCLAWCPPPLRLGGSLCYLPPLSSRRNLDGQPHYQARPPVSSRGLSYHLQEEGGAGHLGPYKAQEKAMPLPPGLGFTHRLPGSYRHQLLVPEGANSLPVNHPWPSPPHSAMC